MSHRPLRELIARLQELQLLAAPVSTDVIITSAPSHDSRLVRTGGIFVAIPGRTADGATFITSAAERGAAAVLSEQGGVASVPLVVVHDARAALAAAAAWWEGDPAEELIAIGVTGTDGKTTTSTFLSTALTAAGLRTGLISTAISRVGGTQRAAAAHQTTPEAPALQRALREMVEAGDEAAVVESTSHGLQLERVGAINFASAIYTTFSPDHLDFHATLDEYRAAKAKLVARTVGSAASRARQLPRVVVVHASDPAVQPFADAAEAAGLQVARFDAYSDHEVLINGVKAELHLTMPGRINAANAAAALTLVAAWGLPLPAAIAAVEAEVGPPGRSQLIGGTQPFRVIVDFAHTGPSLTASVAVARELCSPEGRLLLVTGAAGERDPGRRTAVGQAATGADLVWIADEDPRSEDPNTIGEAIRAALLAASPPPGSSVEILHDRAAAIRAAIGAARPGDVVLLAGKGHERTIERHGVDEAWDEAAAARSALSSLGYSPKL
ncbi:MAG: UDP-N-acetylmuramyl-tripeptide synthetase [Chloroflexi bacterium]|nr:UDP-N-acetylmuramyl-tripeptide synthetase [Chloroflexota bacterium]